MVMEALHTLIFYCRTPQHVTSCLMLLQKASLLVVISYGVTVLSLRLEVMSFEQKSLRNKCGRA